MIWTLVTKFISYDDSHYTKRLLIVFKNEFPPTKDTCNWQLWSSLQELSEQFILGFNLFYIEHFDFF